MPRRLHPPPRSLLGDEADVPRKHNTSPRELLHFADMHPRVREGLEEIGQRFVVEADPPPTPDP